MQISDIYIYPIKSLGGLRQKKAKLALKGLENDRRFMLTNPFGFGLTQRNFRQMALLKTAIRRDKILVWHQDQPENILEIPTQPTHFLRKQKVKIWSLECVGQVMPQSINKWFQNHLETDCQLVYMPDDAFRRMKEKYSQGREIISFADSAPILVIGQQALEDLNKRLEVPVLMNRFRPNLVFSDGQPFEEDHWSGFTVNKEVFKITHRCARCNVPNINQETGKIVKEPNRTLATFRRFNQEIYFGVNTVWQRHLSKGNGVIQIGDKVNPYRE